MHQLVARLEKHEPDQHAHAATLLSAGTMPSLLYSANIKSVNPALLCCMHASRTALVKHVYLSAPRLDSSLSVCSVPPTACSNPVLQDPRTALTCVETCMQELGEVWWLFDAEQPYLAEVFKNGTVPGSRLPHVDRSVAKGNHLARVLGCSRQRMKMVRRNASMCLFTPWCVPAAFHLCRHCASFLACFIECFISRVFLMLPGELVRLHAGHQRYLSSRGSEA